MALSWSWLARRTCCSRWGHVCISCSRQVHVRWQPLSRGCVPPTGCELAGEVRTAAPATFPWTVRDVGCTPDVGLGQFDGVGWSGKAAAAIRVLGGRGAVRRQLPRWAGPRR